MAEVWSLADAEDMVAGEDVPQRFIIRALGSIRDAGELIRILDASPGSVVENMGALLEVYAVADACNDFLTAARKLCRKRPIYPSKSKNLFRAHDRLADVILAEAAPFRVQFPPRRRRRRRRLHAARVLRFLPKTPSKSMGGLVVALRRRMKKVARKIRYASFLTKMLKKTLVWEARFVHNFLRRRVLFRFAVAA